MNNTRPMMFDIDLLAEELKGASSYQYIIATLFMREICEHLQIKDITLEYFQNDKIASMIFTTLSGYCFDIRISDKGETMILRLISAPRRGRFGASHEYVSYQDTPAIPTIVEPLVQFIKRSIEEDIKANS